MTTQQITLKPDLAELATLAEQVERFGEQIGLETPLVFQLNLVLDELVTNAVNYGFARSNIENPHITIEMRREGEQLTIELRDNGTPFDPLQVPPPDLEADLQDRQIGGLGLHFVHELMDTIDYQHQHGENRLTLHKRL